MLVSRTAEAAEKMRRTIDVDGQAYESWDYVGGAPIPGSPGYGQDIDGEDVPQAYLVSQPPHSTTRPHFHLTNQFQVFVGGGGRVGKLRADPLTVQYAGGHTPYGPIFAEAEGLGVTAEQRRKCLGIEEFVKVLHVRIVGEALFYL